MNYASQVTRPKSSGRLPPTVQPLSARALDRKIILVVAAALALGDALQATGVAQWIAQGALGLLMLVGAVVFLISPLLVLWWLTRPSQQGPNQYGPNPQEAWS